ncbi:glycosyltransferase [Jatrophihabitans sp. YIM 134969]
MKDVMRILFSSVPAFGHLLPLVPLARAARAAGHDVAVMTSAGMAPVVATELPDVPFLAAGPMPDVLFAEVVRRIPGHDPLGTPDPDAVAELFAGTRVDLTIDDALGVVRAWTPDVVVSDAVDFVGPLAAAAVGIPSALVAFGPQLPTEFSAPMFAVVASRYADRGLGMQPPVGIFDPVPAPLQAPGWTSDPLFVPVRPEPHRREGASAPASGSAAGSTRVLVTLGTVFGDDAMLKAIVASLPETGVEVVATVGVRPDVDLPADTEHVHYERFRPMAELLQGTDVVVSTGGAGTVLAALSQGIPLVLVPQGADQFINAERAAAAGAALVVRWPDEVGAAVARVLAEPSFSAAATAIRADSDGRPSADAAVAELVRRVRAA